LFSGACVKFKKKSRKIFFLVITLFKNNGFLALGKDDLLTVKNVLRSMIFADVAVTGFTQTYVIKVKTAGRIGIL